MTDNTMLPADRLALIEVLKKQEFVYRSDAERHQHSGASMQSKKALEAARLMTQTIAALSAQPDEPRCGCGTVSLGDDKYRVSVCARHLKSEPAKPLPQDVEEWIRTTSNLVRSIEHGDECRAISCGEVRTYLQQREAAHAADLAAKDAEIAELNRVLSLSGKASVALADQLLQAKEQGRREALQAVPFTQLANALPVLGYSSHPAAHDSYMALVAFLHSARAAQAESKEAGRD